MARRTNPLKSLYYITHIENLASILQIGILSHALVEEKHLLYTPIYDQAIVTNRQNRRTPDDKSLWEYANLYFQPRNPMLYRVVKEKDKGKIAVISIKADVLKGSGVFVTTGNAASPMSEIIPVEQGLNVIASMKRILANDWWQEADGSKRKIMAECLVPQMISPKLIDSIYVADNAIVSQVQALLPTQHHSKVISESFMFFQPNLAAHITPNLTVIDGDMFFSQRQTLTISVNTVGVMGKGLASRTKYQFPDVYVAYQDLCRTKKLQIGRPYLYKRESSFDEMLYDNPLSLPDLNANKWFLLFPTKKHWRSNSNLQEIEQGLLWLRDHYAAEGITSLSLPALGCGLGGLEWKDVGPLMCKYLVGMGDVSIYLPREEKIPSEMLTKAFLLPELN